MEACLKDFGHNTSRLCKTVSQKTREASGIAKYMRVDTMESVPRSRVHRWRAVQRDRGMF